MPVLLYKEQLIKASPLLCFEIPESSYNKSTLCTRKGSLHSFFFSRRIIFCKFVLQELSSSTIFVCFPLFYGASTTPKIINDSTLFIWWHSIYLQYKFNWNCVSRFRAINKHHYSPFNNTLLVVKSIPAILLEIKKLSIPSTHIYVYI